MLQFSQVYKIYEKDRIALFDVSLTVNQGEMVFILGPGGAGKTTFVDLAIMRQFPTKGTVTTLGYNSATLKKRQVPELRRKLGVIFQDGALLKERTVFENVAMAQAVQGLNKKMIREKVVPMLAWMALTEHQDKFPAQLLGGERLRVALARALVNEPYLVVADEPTGNLDETQARDFMALLQKVNAVGTTVVVATHHRRLVEYAPGRVVELTGGRLVDGGVTGVKL